MEKKFKEWLGEQTTHKGGKFPENQINNLCKDLKETIPNWHNVNSQNLFEVTDIKTISLLYQRCLNGGDLKELCLAVGKNRPSNALGRYKEFLESVANKAGPDIWKISHGDKATGSMRDKWLENNQISLHKNTKKNQADFFRNDVKIGDIAVLSYGNNIKRLVKIKSGIVNPEDDWICREYETLKTLSGKNKYTGKQKAWTPNYNTTFEQVKKAEYCKFEEWILKPFFNKNLKDIGIYGKKCQISITETQEKINLLKSKHQIILQGAPGTGKTRLAKEMAYNLLMEDALSSNKQTRAEQWQNFEKSTKKDKDYKLIQFHPAYSYEDFVRGIVATTTKGVVNYEVQNKVLAEMAENAENEPDSPFVLIIDEINRANLSAVLGELIYALEYRGEAVESMYEYRDSRKITLPKNLYIIGTMNTADRSIGHIDYAIRRRFAFVDVHTNEDVIPNSAKLLYKNIKHLFDNSLSGEFYKNDVMIGHSYFLGDLAQALEYEIKPILREYVKDGVLTCEPNKIDELCL